MLVLVVYIHTCMHVCIPIRDMHDALKTFWLAVCLRTESGYATLKCFIGLCCHKWILYLNWFDWIVLVVVVWHLKCMFTVPSQVLKQVIYRIAQRQQCHSHFFSMKCVAFELIEQLVVACVESSASMLYA